MPSVAHPESRYAPFVGRAAPRAAQGGFAFMVFLTLLVVGSTTYITHAVSKASLSVQRDIKTRHALETARAALTAYATKPDKGNPGHLPCPDRTEDPNSPEYGTAEGTCGTTLTRVGRLPWKTLDIEELRDGYGEPLWYAMSRCFLKRNGDQYCGQYLINSNTRGQLAVAGTGVQNAVVIIFAPGPPLPGQQRTPNTPDFVDVSNYLEGKNADGGAQPFEHVAIPMADSKDNFEVRARCEADPCPGGYFNDQLLVVRTEEYFPALEAYVQSRIEQEVAPLLEKHYSYWNAYPYAAPFDGRETGRTYKNPKEALPPMPGESNTYIGSIPLNLHSIKDALEGWDASCSPSTTAKNNVDIRNRSASRLANGSCRIRMDICRKQDRVGSIDAILHTRANGLNRGFFEQPLVTSTVFAHAEMLPGISSVDPVTGQGRAHVHITAPSPATWPLCNTCYHEDGDDCSTDDIEEGGGGGWKTITVIIDPPRLIRTLNPTVAELEDDENPIPLRWFFNNEWHRVIGYQRPETNAMLTISYQGKPPRQAHAALTMAGVPLSPAAQALRSEPPQNRTCEDTNVRTAEYLSAFFEAENVRGCDPNQALSATSELSLFNDRVIPLSAIEP